MGRVFSSGVLGSLLSVSEFWVCGLGIVWRSIFEISG